MRDEKLRKNNTKCAKKMEHERCAHVERSLGRFHGNLDMFRFAETVEELRIPDDLDIMTHA